MCQICLRSPCVVGCPNKLDPEAIYTCESCGEPIVEDDEYLKADNDYYCLGCLVDMGTRELVELLGGSIETAKMPEPDYDDIDE